MGKHNWYEGRWTVRHFRGNELLWEIVDKKNILVDSGEKAVADVFFRNSASVYFAMTDFWCGFFSGSISESSTLLSVPGEPAATYGYSRQKIERSTTGFPTIEKHEGDWRVVSKTLTYSASGGNIGPISGAFLCTSSDNTGTLIGALSFGIERSILAGDSMTVNMKVKLS